MYGFNNTTGTTGSTGAKLGLNQKAKLTAFQFNANAGAGGTEGEALDFTFTLGEKNFMKRIFPIDKLFRPKNGGEITDKNTDEYREAFQKESEVLSSYLCNIVLCFVSEEDLEAALSIDIPDFKTFVQVLERAVKMNPTFDEVELDIFLQYQWAIKGDNSVTFLELPKNTKQGAFVCKHIDSDFSEDKTDTHLRYINKAGEEHPFKRGAWFMESNFANRQSNESTGEEIEGNSSDTAGW